MSDGHRPYLLAFEGEFGPDVDCAQLQNTYGALSDEEARRYSPVRCIGCDMKVVSGDPKHVSASYVERQNWTVRTNMRRYVRLRNRFSRSLRNHGASTALNYFASPTISSRFIVHFARLLQWPAGVTDRLWDVSDLVALWESYARRKEQRKGRWWCPRRRVGPTRKSRRIRITWPQNKKSCSQL